MSGSLKEWNASDGTWLHQDRGDVFLLDERPLSSIPSILSTGSRPKAAPAGSVVATI
jgi:hypothetical protein